MKGILTAIVVLVLVGAGYWFYSQQSATDVAAIPTTDTTATVPAETDAQGAAMETGTIDPTLSTTTTTTSATTTTTLPATAAKTKEFTVTGKNFSFSPATMSVTKGDTVKITFNNTSGFHDLRVDGYNVGTKQIQGGASETVTFVADKAGTFEYYCSVGNHRAMGMKGTLTVK